jgi:hypothetical protein
MFDYHPLCELFPLATPEEMAELKADIKANGLRSPIVLFEEKILDGRGRYEVCSGLAIVPEMRQFDPETEGSPFAYVVSMNLRRRHLTTEQRAALAVRLEPMFTDDAESRRLANLKKGAVAPEVANLTPSGERGKSIEKAAAAAGVSPTSVKNYAARKGEPGSRGSRRCPRARHRRGHEVASAAQSRA